ncbi:response regulator [Paenibacillus oenotherae]|uniref:Response regulator n=1 Tax=Paenibacillus oenotherae TaxID=1435645 RepID=A0ABS7D497_9BACL|nr:response regulator [Paenibacillus oenotherae]MBW7474754.1 response regulator [Paenibacillus oenotherae]
MYRILIVDDEALEREGLEWIARNMLQGKLQVFHAENGRIAIERAEEHHPHIVLMDVNMPGIQGLDAIREIKSRLPDTKFVLVTAYDYFAYAKEALTLGVKEYIVKPAKRTQVVATLQGLMEELDREKSKRAEELELRHRVSQLMPLVESELALVIMVRQVMDADAGQLAEWLDFPLDGGSAVVAAFPRAADVRDKKIYDTMRSFAKTNGTPCIVSSLIDRHMTIFLRIPPGAETDVWKQETVQFGGELCSLAERQLGMAITVGIGSARQGAEGLHESYFEAVFASACFEQGGKVCHFDDLKRGQEAAIPVPGMAAAEDEDALNRSYVASALHRIREEREQQTLSVLDRAKAFIEERFTEDLSLEEVADYVHLNPYYLSKILKQQFGETFIDLLTRLRIDKAKGLIASKSLSLKEICFEVGYKDPNYFSRVFKRVTGITPSEYRSSETS